MPDSEIKKILIDAVIEIYERKKAESGETLTFYPSSETLTDVMGKVIANFIMTDDYRIEITFSMEKSKKYICKLTAKAIVNRRTSRYEEEKAVSYTHLIGIASQALGIAQGAFDVTVEYMQARKQFGKKLSQMQALQFEMANLKTKIEASRLLIYKAADLKDKHLPYGEAAAMAKLFAAETVMEVTTKCVQFHGGYGYTKAVSYTHLL